MVPGNPRAIQRGRHGRRPMGFHGILGSCVCMPPGKRRPMEPLTAEAAQRLQQPIQLPLAS
jgi:hypothetical protein